MEPRRRQARVRQAKRPTSEPHARSQYAAGEDAATSIGRRTPVTGRRTRAAPKGAAATLGRFSAGDEALAEEEPQRARWRQSRTLAGAARTNPRAGLRAVSSLLRRIPPGRAVSAGISTTLLVALAGWMLTGSYWQARDVRIRGTSDPTLLTLIHAQRLTGCNVFRCDLSAARQAIAASPLAQRVSITIVYPETTLVNVTQRQTVAVWRTQGQAWAVGADGVIIGTVERDSSLASESAAVVDDASGVAFTGQAPQPGGRMDAALVAMASQLRMNAVGAGLDPTSLRYSAQDGLTLQARGGALVVFGGPADAQATLADSSGASPAPAAQPLGQVTPAQASEGARLQVEAAAAILARLAQTHTSASLIDVRWGMRPYYR